MPPITSSATAPSIRVAVSDGVLVCSTMGDLRATARQDVPLRTELVDVLAGGIAGLRVAGEVVERVAVIGHLGSAVGSLRGAEQRGADLRACLGGPGNGEWRP